MSTQRIEQKVALVGSNRLELVGIQALLEKAGESSVRLILHKKESPPSIDSFADVDIVCFDFDSTGLAPERLTRPIKNRFPGALIVWTSQDQRDHGQFIAISAGADGFTEKTRVAELLDAFYTVSSGDYHFCPHVLLRYIKQINLLAPNRVHPTVSARESEVLTLVRSGATNAQIATALKISAETVKVHLRQIRRAFGLSKRR